MVSPALYNAQWRFIHWKKKLMSRLANQMQYQRKNFLLRNREGVVIIDPEQLAQECVQKIESTITQVLAPAEECSNLLIPFFLRHAHQPLYHMLSRPLTY